jgi:hypothetical protein
MNRHLKLIFVTILMAPVLAAAQAKDDLSQLTYPELEVTPLASERLEIEARKERANRFAIQWPAQLSALVTLVAADTAHPKDNASSGDRDRIRDGISQGRVIGGAWLGATVLLSGLYNPYRRGYAETAKLPDKTTREKLTRERLSEEALYAPADLAWKIEVFSVATEFYATMPFILYGDANTKTMGAIAAFAAFAPLIFEYRWSSVARQHREYKKKIYGPTTGPVLLPKENGQVQLGYGLAYSF